MKKDESVFHSQIMRWLKYNLQQFPKSFLIETKVVRREKKSFPYKELSEKEERLLLRCKNSSILNTNSDYGGLGTFCDGYCLSGGGYIFLKWMRPRNKTFYIIDIENFINHRKISPKKSLTEDEVKAISYLICKHQ
jgi:hypothetical protein